MKNDDINDFAFPVAGALGANQCNGMTLRDYFAIHVDQPGVLELVTAAGFTHGAGQVWQDPQTSLGSFETWYRTLTSAERAAMYAKVRYELSDAMLQERAK